MSELEHKITELIHQLEVDDKVHWRTPSRDETNEPYTVDGVIGGGVDLLGPENGEWRFVIDHGTPKVHKYSPSSGEWNSQGTLQYLKKL